MKRPALRHPPHRRAPPQAAGAALLALVCALPLAQAQVAPQAAAPAAPAVLAPGGGGGPRWAELSPAQQAALRPLAGRWDHLPAAQKRKWLQTSQNLRSVPAPEQTKARERMPQWSAMSPEQRAAARLNFAETRALTDGLTPEQRQVQWQAYQLLSPQEKKKLAADARGLPATSAALAVRPAQPLVQALPPPEFGTAAALSRVPATPVPARRIAQPPQRAVGEASAPQRP